MLSRFKFLLGLMFCLAGASGVFAQGALDYFNRAAQEERSGDFGGTITNATRAIELQPDLVQAYFLRGSAEQVLSNYDEAIADFERVTSMKPGWAVAYKEDALARGAKGDWQGMADELKQTQSNAGDEGHLAVEIRG